MMISLLQMMASTITGAFIYVLKAFFSLLTWFVKCFLKAVKMLYVALPVTCIVFILLFLINIFMLFTGTTVSAPQIPDSIQGAEDIQMQADVLLQKDHSSTSKTFSELFNWWFSSVYIYKGSVAYIFLLILTILMFVPVVTVLLCITVLGSFGSVLFISVVVDAALYLLRAVIGQTFLKQAQGRYYRLFPEAGKKHYEKNYDRWIKEKSREADEDRKMRKRRRADDFYGDEDPGYDDEYDEKYDDEYDDGYDDDYPEDEDYDDEGYDNYPDDDYYEDTEEIDEAHEDDVEEDFEDDYDAPANKKGTQTGTFDFFAGCTSRESVDKKYRSLVKLYHPDNMDGDTAALQEINVQYEMAKKRF